MPTIEERLQALEQEHTQFKKTIELQTIAIRALVSKEAFEKLQDTVEKSQEQNRRMFDALIAHDRLTNEQLAELRSQQTELDGKIAGVQTEMRQHFTETDGKVVGLQTEMRQRFTEQDGKITGLQTEMRQRLSEQDNKIAGLDSKVAGLDSKVAGLQTEMRQRFSRIETVLAQILARLPEQP